MTTRTIWQDDGRNTALYIKLREKNKKLKEQNRNVKAENLALRFERMRFEYVISCL